MVAFPSAERVLAACLESIRRVQAQHTSKRGLDNNRVFLHVWPTIEVPLTDLAGFAQMSAPLTLGTGLAEITVLARLRGRWPVMAARVRGTSRCSSRTRPAPG